MLTCKVSLVSIHYDKQKLNILSPGEGGRGEGGEGGRERGRERGREERRGGGREGGGSEPHGRR